MNTTMILLIVLIVGFLLIFLFKKFCVLPSNSIFMANGGIGAGKTCLIVCLAIQSYIGACFKWLLGKYVFAYIFFWKYKTLKSRKKPLLYSNLPLRWFKYVPLTSDLVYGIHNFRPRSVILIAEASLVADNMSWQTIDQEKFVERIKLFRHATLGGKMFIDTQSFSDLNYAIKRSINSYVWIEKFINIPFFPFLIWRLRPMLVCDENVQNVVTEDLHASTRLYITTKISFLLYNTYNYYGLYENVPCASKTIKEPRGSRLESKSYIKLSSRKEEEKRYIKRRLR